MKRWIVVATPFLAGIFAIARPAAAQFFGGYDGFGFGDGGAALLGSNLAQAQAMQLKAQARQANQQAAIGQNMVVQSGIRNTLSNQAGNRTQAIVDRQQATKDWWFQQQQQQMALRPPPSADYATSAPVVGWSGMAPRNRPPPAAMDVIQWPALLQEPCFASERMKIEAPYRRSPPAPGSKFSEPTVADFREMASAVEDMKAVLQWRLGEGVDTNQYNQAKDFLDKMSSQIARQMK